MKNSSRTLSALCRKLFAILLVAAFAFGTLPSSFGVLAEDGKVEQKAPLNDGAPTRAANGNIGPDISWNLNNSGELTLKLWDSRDFGGFNRSIFSDADWPWHSYRSSIKSVTFKFNAKGTPISFHSDYKINNMFRDCVNLETVTIETMEKEVDGETVVVPAFDISIARGMGHMFRGCTKLKTVDLGALEANGNFMVDLEYMFAESGVESVTLPKSINFASPYYPSYNVQTKPSLAYMFDQCNSLKTINNLDGLDVSNITSMEHMFYGCTSLETLDLSSFGKMDNIWNMRSFVGSCSSLDTLILDNMDNSNIGPHNERHCFSRIHGNYDQISEENAKLVGAVEYYRDLGLKSCTKLRVLSVNNAKVWMCPDNRGTDGNEYYKAANDREVLWWWCDAEDEGIKDGVTQLKFTSGENPEVSDYMLTKRDYVDLILDRDGKAGNTHGYTVDGSAIINTALPDAETNINVKYDLNPNGAGFLAPGVYQTGEVAEQYGYTYMQKYDSLSGEHAPIEYTEYRVHYIGEVPYEVYFGDEVVANSNNFQEEIVKGDFVIKNDNIYGYESTYINTVPKTAAEWNALKNANGDVVLDNCNIKIIYENAAIDSDGNKHSVEIFIDKITFKDIDKIEQDPDRLHDGNSYYDTDGNGEYFRTVLLATKNDGLFFRNYVKSFTPSGGEISVLSGGSGTDIDFSVKIAGAEEGTHFIFYTGDLDVTSFQNWEKPNWNDQCFDNLPIENAVYGVGGESFVIRNSADSIWFAPHTGLKLETASGGSKAGERIITSTGSDPNTPWSEFTVRSDAFNGGSYTWVSGTACDTHALRNTPKVSSGEEYIVYDFSTSIGHVPFGTDESLMGIITLSDEKTTDELSTFTTEKTIDGFTFKVDPSDSKRIMLEVKSISSAPVTVTALLKYNVSLTQEGATEYEWRKIVLVPATNVHYEESYLNYTDGAGSVWEAEGTAINPVYDVTSGAMIGTGTDRQSDANERYGYDGSYEAQTLDSNGRSMHVHVGQAAFDAGGAWPTFNFTFTGTAFDIIGRTGVNTGVYVVNVRNSDGTVKKSQIINTRYFGTSWQGENGDNGNIGDDLRQVPIIHIDSYKSGGVVQDLPYDTYTVNVQLIWMKGLAALPIKGMPDIPGIPVADYEFIGFDSENEKANYDYDFPEFDVYVDAIRIYNPADASDPIVEAAYTAAGELAPTYSEIRDIIIEGGLDAGSAYQGAIAIDLTPHQRPVYKPAPAETQLLDANGNPVYENGVPVYTEFIQKLDANGKPVYNGNNPVYEPEIDANGDPVYAYDMPQGGFENLAEAYQNYGPNNEMYLTAGQGFAFKLEGIPSLLHISAKVPYGGTMTMEVHAIVDGQERDYIKSIPISSATEMYYDCGEVLNGISGENVYIVVVAKGSGILSVCELKTVAGGSINPNIVADRSALELLAAIVGGTKGDVNADGSIDVTDALLAMRAALDPTALGAYGRYCADINNDGSVDLQDALVIMRNALI